MPDVPWLNDDFDPVPVNKAFGVNLQNLRRVTGQSRTDVCKRTSGTLRYSTFAALETGNREPSAKTLPLMAQGLGVQAADLQALWNALQSEGPADRAIEVWSRLQKQAREDRERREETASRIEEKLREFVATNFPHDSAAEAAARTALTAYAVGSTTAGAAVAPPSTPALNLAAAGGAIASAGAPEAPEETEPSYWQVSGISDWQPPEVEEIILDIWNDKPNERLSTERLGQVFQGIRDSEGWSVEEVAGRLGLRPDQVIAVETGSYIPDTDLVKDMILSLRREVQDTGFGIVLRGADGQRYCIEMDGPRFIPYPGKTHLDEGDREHLEWLLERVVFGTHSPMDNNERRKVGAIVQLALLSPSFRDKIYDRYLVSVF